MTFAALAKSQRVVPATSRLAKGKARGGKRLVGSPSGFIGAAPRLGATMSAHPPGLQTKLKVGEPNDRFEQEADRVADQVMRMPVPGVSIAPEPPRISRKCAECEEEAQTLQTKTAKSSEAVADEAPGILYDVLRAPGQALDRDTRALFEPHFGHDFSQVRVHNDELGGESARAVGADAYTVGSHIAFASNRYAPQTGTGQHLLAHELVHVVQQRFRPVSDTSTKCLCPVSLQRQPTGRSARLPLPAAAPSQLSRKTPPVPDEATAAVPWTTIRDWAVAAINAYEAAANLGLDDFEKGFPERESGTNWGLFAATVLGNLVWALACFETGGTAFFISLAGIGIGSAAAGAMNEGQKSGFDKPRFHHAVREAISAKGGIADQLMGKVVDGAHGLEKDAAAGHWDSGRAHRETLRRLFKGDDFVKDEADEPAVNKWTVAKRVEAELLIQAAAGTPYYKGSFESGGGYRTGVTEGYDEGVWLQVGCDVTDAFEADGRTSKPIKDWEIHLKKATIWDRTEQLPQMAERLTAIFGKDLSRPMPIFDWPLRKSLWVDLLGSKADSPPSVQLDLDERSAIRRQQLRGAIKEVEGHTYFVLADKRSSRISDWNARAVVELALTRQAIRIHEVSQTPKHPHYHP